MKPFDIGTKVEILHSDGDNAPDWKSGVVVNQVTYSPGFERHGAQHGNIVQLDNGKCITVTEPSMITKS